jgi:hypothetical protein
MRNELMLACSLLAVPLTGSVVNIRPANVMMSSGPGISAACNGAVETACTRFDGTSLDCSCARRGDRWSPIVRIDARPRMYLSNSMYLLHELSHVFDFKRAMQRHADDIESHSFPSLDACDDFAHETLLSFDEVLIDFRRTSMLHRDHRLSNGK